MEALLTSPLILLALMFALMYFMMIRPENKRKKQAEEMRSNLKKGDQITTIGGIVGKIVMVNEETIIIETSDDRVRMELTKWSVSTVGVQSNEVVIAGAFKVAKQTEMAVSVKVDSVHIDGAGIAEVVVKGDVFNSEIGHRVESYTEVCGILDSQIADLEIFYVIEKHGKAVKFSDGVIVALLWVWLLLHIVAVPDATAKLNILIKNGGKIIYISPGKTFTVGAVG